MQEDEFYPNKEYRNICFTLNNYTEDEAKLVMYSTRPNITFQVVGKEIGEECKTPHLQGYVEFKSSVKGSTMLKYPGWKRMHLGKRKGNASQAADYCMKGEQTKEEFLKFHCDGPNFGKNADYVEFGEISSQGIRNDLMEAVERLQNGDIKDVKELSLSEPKLFHIYGRTLAQAETMIKKNITRESLNINTEGIWFYGGTGIGKSHAARIMCGDESKYNWKKASPWQDMYDQQDNVIIDEFRGNTMMYSDLLEMIDKWNWSVDRRYLGPIPFISKRVIITSSLAPWDCYNNLMADDKLDQLERRFIVLTKKNIKDEWNIITEKWSDIVARRELEEIKLDKIGKYFTGVKNY